jgi:co-chaperonin GroES (HSP10)
VSSPGLPDTGDQFNTRQAAVVRAEVKIDGQELLIMKESDIMGIIDEPVAKKKAA